MDFYVFPHCPRAEGALSKLEECGRLWAYPATPVQQKCRITILDSGAYGLFQSGRKMSRKYFRELSEHYQTYNSKNTLCVAPDVVCDPMQTMYNFARWHRASLFPHVCPVIQPDNKHKLDFELYRYQADYYITNFHAKTIFLSNWLSAEMAVGQGIQRIVDYIRSCGVEYIHVLGAGWDMRDVLRWHTVRGVNSCDSIAYYTDGAASRFGSDKPEENARRILCELKKRTLSP